MSICITNKSLPGRQSSNNANIFSFCPAYPDIIALQGSQVRIPCNTSYLAASQSRPLPSTTTTTMNTNHHIQAGKKLNWKYANPGPNATRPSKRASPSPVGQPYLFVSDDYSVAPRKGRASLSMPQQQHYSSGQTLLSGDEPMLSSPPSSSHDSAKLILWYHGGDISGNPIYTVDSRDDPMPNAQYLNTRDQNNTNRHFVPSSHSNRTSVNLHSDPIYLVLNDVTLNDTGTYWCRVDFRWTRTLISTVQLRIHGKWLHVHLVDCHSCG